MSDKTLHADFFEILAERWEIFLCEKVSSYYEAGDRVYILADSEALARKLDDMLWIYREDSFVPHSLWQGEDSAVSDPVVIGWKNGNPNGALKLAVAGKIEPARLLELSASFGSVSDFVAKRDDNILTLARERFRALRDSGAKIDYHPAQTN